MIAKLNWPLLITRSVPSADVTWAAPRARINPGIASVESNPTSATSNSISISVKPDSPRALPALVQDIVSPSRGSPLP